MSMLGNFAEFVRHRVWLVLPRIPAVDPEAPARVRWMSKFSPFCTGAIKVRQGASLWVGEEQEHGTYSSTTTDYAVACSSAGKHGRRPGWMDQARQTLKKDRTSAKGVSPEPTATSKCGEGEELEEALEHTSCLDDLQAGCGQGQLLPAWPAASFLSCRAHDCGAWA